MRTAAERKRFVEVRAEQMKVEPTPAERRMWDILIRLGFDRQRTICGHTKNGLPWYYILDFYHEKLKLCVEVDGGVHAKRKGRDRRRDARLRGEGIETLRYTNKHVLTMDAGILQRDVMAAMLYRRAVG